MTNLGGITQVFPACPQLPVSAYFDKVRFQREQETIFKHTSRYIGHRSMVPEVGDWYTLAQENYGRALIHHTAGIELISNVCRHRQALMLGSPPQPAPYQNPLSDSSQKVTLGPPLPHLKQNTGNLRHTGGNIVCPLHRWTYDSRGKLLGAPKFETPPCLNLQRFPLHDCHGLLFEGPRHPTQDLATLFARPEFDFSDYVLDHVEIHPCHYNWKTFLEVYLEDYHVEPFHPGLGHFVTCNDLIWEFGPWHSVQQVGVHRALAHPGSHRYHTWQDKLLTYRQGDPPHFGAIWATYFPTNMIEVYPHTLVISTLYPQSPQYTLNVVEFYYPEEIVAFEREFVQAQQAAYMETAKEDDDIAERMDAGRRALMQYGISETGPYQSPLENGMQHFHKWYRHIMKDTTPAWV